MRIGSLAVTLAAMLALAAGHAAALSANGAPKQSGAPAAGSASYRLDWAAAGTAAGNFGASANYQLYASTGMASAGTASESLAYRACLGIQCPPAFQSVFVPVVTR